MLEQQIYSIESANINHETIIAMKNASDALKQIHGNLTMDKVDQTMFVTAWLHSVDDDIISTCPLTASDNREEIQAQHELSKEIANAITSTTIGDPVDEDELENELEQLEQEDMDKKMLGTGTVPVSDSVHRLPAAANGERKTKFHILQDICCNR